MQKIIKRFGKYTIYWLLSGLGLLVFLLGTDPLDLPLPVLLLPFVIFFIWVRNGILAVTVIATRIKSPSRKWRILANGTAAILVLTVTLQSLGQLSWRDILLILSLVVGVAFYFHKTDLMQN